MTSGSNTAKWSPIDFVEAYDEVAGGIILAVINIASAAAIAPTASPMAALEEAFSNHYQPWAHQQT